MRRLVIAVALLPLCFLLGCLPARINTSNPDLPHHAYLDGGGSRVGVILCHGRGQHPTAHVVNPLRLAIHGQLGYHTLSLQMPAPQAPWALYREFFADAYKRIWAAIRVLRQEKGVKTIYLLGHSMGSRMASGFLARFPEAGVAGFIGVGVRNNGRPPLDSVRNLQLALQRNPRLMVLDVYGDGGDGRDAQHAQKRAKLVGDRYRQILIPGADHRFIRGEEEMVAVVVRWLGEQKNDNSLTSE